MRPSTLSVIAAAVIASIAACGLAQPAGARVLQTFGDTLPQKLRYAQNIALGPSGSVYVLDTSGTLPDANVRVKVYSPTGAPLRDWRVATRNEDIFDMAVDATENVYVAVGNDRKILKYSPAGRLLAEVRLPGPGDPGSALSIAIDPVGRLVVAEGGGRLSVFDAAGRLVATRELLSPQEREASGIYGLAVTASGATYVSDLRGVALVDPAGGASRYVARRGPRPQDVNGADPIAAGPDNSLYVVDVQGIRRVQRYAADGTYLGSVGAELFGWNAAAVASDGSIFALASYAGTGSAVQHVAPIATVDVQPPSVAIDRVEPRPRGRNSRVTVRLTYTLSERAAVRVAFLRLVDRGRYAGRYRHTETIRVKPAAAGRHTLQWFASSLRAARLKRGEYKVFVVAWDDAGLESLPEHVSFSLRRRP